MRQIHGKLYLIALLSSLLCLQACSWGGNGSGGKKPAFSGGYSNDGPGRLPSSSDMQDAKPKWEPRTRAGNAPKYKVMGKTYYTLKTAEGYRNRGTASWYGRKFHGNKTANGERYDMYGMTAAHKTLPIPSYVKVRNLRNGREAIVRVNDRGPFIDNREIDLSYAAAVKLGVFSHGTAPVEVTGIEVSRNGRWHSLPDTVPAPQPAAYPRASAADLAAMRSGSNNAYPTPTTQPRHTQPAVSTAPQFQAQAIEPVSPPPPSPAAAQASATPAYTTAAATTAAAVTNRWWVQTGAFSSHSGAATLSTQLQQQGFPNSIVNTHNSPLAYKVRVGPFEIETHARWAQASLGDKGLNKGFVIQAPMP